MKSINDLRSVMFEVLQGVKDGTIEIDKAKAANDVAQTLINSAKVEVDFIKATGGTGSSFLEPQENTALPDGVVRVTRHRLAG